MKTVNLKCSIDNKNVVYDDQGMPWIIEDMVLNLTQHQATQEQVNAGVVEPADKQQVQKLLTFDRLPSNHDLVFSANELAKIASKSGCRRIMIGGAPFFMPVLEGALRREGLLTVYAFSERVSVEETLPDGSVRKTNVFKHVGFVGGE